MMHKKQCFFARSTLIWILFCSIVFGDMLDDKIQELIGTTTYSQNKNFINTIFSNRAKFYLDSNQLNIGAIAYELKNNGLLMLKFPKPMDLSVSFSAQASPIILSYTLNNVLSSMGYSYFLVSQASKINNTSTIRFSLITEHALDPMILLSELQKRGFSLKDIMRNSINEWAYIVEARNPTLLNAKSLETKGMLSLREVSGQYWFRVVKNGNLKISANPKWTPRIVCYNKNLEITNLIIERNPKNSINMRIDDRIAFIMITDVYNPDIIKQIEVEFLP